MGMLLLVSFVALAIVGVPIAFVLGCSAFVSMWFGSTQALTIIPQQMFAACDSFPLLAIPLFMIAGSLMGEGGISKRLINLADACVGHYTAGMAYVGIITCMIFAAISGSGPATVASVGGIMIPAMVAAGYDKGFACAVMAIAGSIGIIIPPSIPMVTYGVSANASIGGLFTSGFGPGILIGLSLMACSYFLCKKGGFGLPAHEKMPMSARWKAFKDAILALFMPFIILGGIYGGIFTPTEAAAVACFYGLIVGVFVYKELPVKKLGKVLVDSAVTTAMIMLIIAAAKVFGWIMTSEKIPDAMARAILAISDHSFVILLLINILLLFVGCFMETNAALVIFTPILLPVATTLGLSPIHFGAIMIVNLAIGMVTPPLGVNLFVACGIEKISIDRISKAVLPLIVVNVIDLLLITYIEPISMFLVHLAGQG